MPNDQPNLADIVATAANALRAQTYALSDSATLLPNAPGVYAWWADDPVLPQFDGHSKSGDSNDRLIYLGLATNLRKRVLHNHLRRSGSSTLRRTLAGLLLDSESYRTRFTDRVVLLDVDEIRLTEWMHAHLQLSWYQHPQPKKIESDLIRRLRPSLNVDHSDGADREVVTEARRRYRSSVDRNTNTPLP